MITDVFTALTLTAPSTTARICGGGTPSAIPFKDRHSVAFAALWQIKRANVFFAWIESETAYGTLAEIGVARALNKTVWFGGPERIPEHWFPESMCDCVSYGYRDPAEFLADCLTEKLDAPYTARKGRLYPSQGNPVLQN